LNGRNLIGLEIGKEQKSLNTEFLKKGIYLIEIKAKNQLIERSKIIKI